VTRPPEEHETAGPDPIGDPDRVVIRDKRRLDPETGAVRDGGVAAAAAAPADPLPDDLPPTDLGGEAAAGDARVEELTADLQRVSAEYANYRKRVDRDRVAVVEMATAGLLSELLPVLDDVDRARQHGDLTGAFQAVGERLEGVTAKLGLERFGEPGEPFDPSVHEALMQAEPDPSASVPTCAQVLQPGYRLKGGRVLRPARVSVAEPGAEASDAPAATEPG
jgi:molecular chaperone GrpE